MEFVIVLVILTLVVLIVTAPLRPSLAGWAGAARAPSTTSAELDELEAAQAAKYREIRDADLDHRTGKLSDLDFEEIDYEAALRGDRHPARAGSGSRETGEQLPSDEL